MSKLLSFSTTLGSVMLASNPGRLSATLPVSPSAVIFTSSPLSLFALTEMLVPLRASSSFGALETWQAGKASSKGIANRAARIEFLPTVLL